MKKMTWGLYTLFGFFRCSWLSNSILGQFERVFQPPKALLLFEEMLKVQLQYDSISCRATIRACERGKQWQQVLALFASMSGWSDARYLWSMFPDDLFFVWQSVFYAWEHGMDSYPHGPCWWIGCNWCLPWLVVWVADAIQDSDFVTLFTAESPSVPGC